MDNSISDDLKSFIKTDDLKSFIKTDDNRVINEKYIRWVHKINDYLQVCTKENGCHIDTNETHKISKLKSLDSYNKLNRLFN